MGLYTVVYVPQTKYFWIVWALKTVKAQIEIYTQATFNLNYSN